MKVAVACNGMNVSPFAAQCESFTCYTVNKGVISDCRNLPNMGITGAEAAKLINDLGFEILITNGIDVDMANLLCECGVEVVAGVQGTAREAVERYISSTLMGAIELCDAHAEQHDPEDQDVEDAFEEMAKSLGL